MPAKYKLSTRLMTCVATMLFLTEMIAFAILPTGITKPKHYILVAEDRGFTNSLKIMTNANIAGVQSRFEWKDLETSKGVYDFSIIEAQRNALAAVGKELIVEVTDKDFHGFSRVPLYLTTEPQYNGGTYTNGSDVTGRRWDPAVLPRYYALFEALGAQFSGRVGGVNFEETAMAVGSPAPSGFSNTAYLLGISNIVRSLRLNFPGPTNSVLLYANFMPGGPSHVQALANYCVTVGAGIGGPDIAANAEFSSDTSIESAYNIWRTKKGSVPLAAALQYFGYEFVDALTGQPQSMEAVYQYATNYIKLDAIFWQAREPWFSQTNDPDFNVMDTIARHPSVGNVPMAPASLDASAVSSNQINLTWSDVAEETGFRLWRSLTNGGPYTQVGGDLAVSVTNYNDTSLSVGTTYYYVVSAFNTNGSSGNSPQAQATTQGEVTNDPSLVLHWRLDETSGTTAADATGKGHTGTLNSNPTWVTGRFGGALNFTYTNWVATPNTNDLQLATNLTIALWVKMNTIDAFGYETLICKKSGNSSGSGFEIGYLALNPSIRVRGSGGTVVTNSLSPGLGTNWHHLAVVYNNTSVAIYVDGVSAPGSGSVGAVTTNATELRLGRNTYNTVGFEGALDGVRIYNRSLSQSEIQALMLSDYSVGEAAPPAPPLNATPGGGQMTLGWNDAAFQLYSATNLTPPVVWTLWSGALTTNNGMINALIPASQGQQFFRLNWP